MLQPLQLQEVSTRYAREIAEIHDFLLKAGFTPGTPASLGTIVARLQQDRTVRRDLTSHVWVLLHTSKANYSEMLGIVTLAVAGPQLAADADEDEAHELLRFLMGARGSFEEAPVPARTVAAPTPAPVAEVVAPPPAVAPVVAVPVAETVASATVLEPVTPVAAAPVARPPVPEAPIAARAYEPAPGNLRPLRTPGDLPPLRWGSSTNDLDDEPEEKDHGMVLGIILCLLAVVLFGVAIWRYDYVKQKQREVDLQHQQQLEQQQQQATPATH